VLGRGKFQEICFRSALIFFGSALILFGSVLIFLLPVLIFGRPALIRNGSPQILVGSPLIQIGSGQIRAQFCVSSVRKQLSGAPEDVPRGERRDRLADRAGLEQGLGRGGVALARLLTGYPGIAPI
jgi:hypothetical protein